MTDNELLLEISNIMHTQLQPIVDRLDQLEERMDRLEARIDSLETRVTALENRMDKVELEITEAKTLLENRIDKSELEIREVKMLIETQLLPMQKELSAYGMSTYRRYEKATNQTESMEQDLHILMRVVAEHSKELSRPS